MPKLEEGNFWIRATLPMSISLEQSAKYVGPHARDPAAAARDDAGAAATRRNRKHPEVATVVSQLGRPDDGTDVVGLPQHRALRAAQARSTSGRAASPRRSSPTSSRSELHDGVPRRGLQLLADDLATTSRRRCRGVKGENSVKVFGPDLQRQREQAPTRSST